MSEEKPKPTPPRRVQPITPDEIIEARKNYIPEEVIECFNDLITLNWDGTRAVIQLNEVIKHIQEALIISRKQVFDLHYLDVEDIYREAGWRVVYDKPGHSETYPAFFEFTKKT